ncbi:MAG: glutamine-hydrolyzing carbamoyl-phosphate synthase small subunit [Thermoplasmata archaeon]
MRGFLVLEDGTVFEGEAFGAQREVLGEVVFATGMTGYQESLTDPSYCGQILVSSYPLIGNYGINAHDFQSHRVQVWGYVVREKCSTPSHRHCARTIDEFLAHDNVPGICGIDTRSLIRRLRNCGTMKGGISTGDPDQLLDKVRKLTHPEESNLVSFVSTKEIIKFDERKSKSVALFDCGIKSTIIEELRKRFNVIQLPFDTPEEKVREFQPDGIFISNGPGNPAHPEMMATTVATLRKLKDDYPMMGICLGNQLLSLMFGAKTYKLKFGHRGINQPVRFEDRVYITSQNHGFAVDARSAEDAGLEITFVNLNDGTVEGMRHRELPIFSVQFHPEAHPGPQDTGFLFDRFKKMLEVR